MNKKVKAITFIITYIISYLIIGFIINGLFVGIKWSENATAWHIFREFYIRNAGYNIVPAFIISIISVGFINMVYDLCKD